MWIGTIVLSRRSRPGEDDCTLPAARLRARKFRDIGASIRRKGRMVAAYLDAEVNRMSGDEFYELRWKANLSQAEFAERLGVSQASISGMELGRRPVTAQAATLAIMRWRRERVERRGRS